MYQRILVPVDGSATSTRGLEEAIGLARITGGRLCLFHSIDGLSLALAANSFSPRPGEYIKELRDEGRRLLGQSKTAANAAGVAAETVLQDRYSEPVHQQVSAVAEEWGADLIVIGTHGRRGVDRLLMGSSAEMILRNAAVPVLLVRAPVTPSNAKAKDESGHAEVGLPSSALSAE